MSLLSLPVVATQALWVRSRTPKLPPASGPTSATTGGDGPDPDRPYRLAVVGESTAAGVGVSTHDDGFTGSLARELAARTGRSVEWTVVGRDGATARRIRHRLVPELIETASSPWDTVVVLAGVNDVLGRRDPGEWSEDLTAIIDELSRHAARVVIAGVPPFEQFPSVPRTLARFLARRAAALDTASQRVCAGRPRTVWVSSTDSMPMRPEFFSSDRFHPGALGYEHWARLIAEHVMLSG